MTVMTRTSQCDNVNIAAQAIAGIPESRSTDWRRALPVLVAPGVSLRELRSSDAAALCDPLRAADVARFISPPPGTVTAFERFITWSLAEQRAGRGACFGIAVSGLELPVGLVQLRALEPGFSFAEWGVAIGRPFWGTGVFTRAARLLLEFAFDTLGVYRLEARVAVGNARANGALAKLGAVREATLRRSLECSGVWHDQALWSIVRDDWRRARAITVEAIH